MNSSIKKMIPTAEAIEKLLHPHAEVVIHDIKKNKISAIFNSFSKRRSGDNSLLTESELSQLSESQGPYEKRNWDGRKLKSVSSIIRDESGKMVGLFCINLDISHFEKINTVIMNFIRPDQFTEKPKPLFEDDWQEKMNVAINDYLKNHHLTLKSIKRDEKKKMILHLQKIGAFSVKNAAFYIAKILNVSRATIYNYLAENVK